MRIRSPSMHSIKLSRHWMILSKLKPVYLVFGILKHKESEYLNLKFSCFFFKYFSTCQCFFNRKTLVLYSYLCIDSIRVGFHSILGEMQYENTKCNFWMKCFWVGSPLQLSHGVNTCYYVKIHRNIENLEFRKKFRNGSGKLTLQ